MLGWACVGAICSSPYLPQSLHPGRVVVEHRDAYRIETEGGERSGALAGRLRHRAERRSDLPAVGDFVAIRVPESNAGDGPAIVEAVLPRRTAFVRRAAGGRPDDQMIAANIDTVFVMTGLDHDFNVRRTERYLAAVWESGASPVVLLNKTDLCPDVDQRVDQLRSVAIGVDVHAVSALTAEGVGTLAEYLHPGVTVGFVGSSGVGKSTLLNRLLGRDVQATAGVRAQTAAEGTRPRIANCSCCRKGAGIDTPGMREFTLSDADEGLTRSSPTSTRCRRMPL